MATLDPVTLPAVNQGVRIIAHEGSPDFVQITAVVAHLDSKHRLRLKLPVSDEVARLALDLPVRVEYFRNGTLFNLEAQIDIIESDREAGRASIRLRAPQSGKSVRSRRSERLDVSLPIVFMRVDAPEKFAEDSRAGAKKIKKWGSKIVNEGNTAHTEVISAHGLRILTSVALPLGASIYFEMELAGVAIRQVGQVVWTSDDPGHAALGIAYVGTSDSTRLAIDEFVNAQSSRPE